MDWLIFEEGDWEQDFDELYWLVPDIIEMGLFQGRPDNS